MDEDVERLQVPESQLKCLACGREGFKAQEAGWPSNLRCVPFIRAKWPRPASLARTAASFAVIGPTSGDN